MLIVFKNLVCLRHHSEHVTYITFLSPHSNPMKETLFVVASLKDGPSEPHLLGFTLLCGFLPQVWGSLVLTNRTWTRPCARARPSL